LTLKDLKALAQSFKATLRAVYHPRIEYPAPSEAELLLRRLPIRGPAGE
jgi:membrane-associated HD superfamily phosphohydrolase